MSAISHRVLCVAWTLRAKFPLMGLSESFDHGKALIYGLNHEEL